ncbi:hypothetical protein PVK06_027027 [Gossypium arboreum]|uniref:Uncharacterized protein n=1 Tax=Gossypium arboreum TaxID=29729 RepID=A0ABR0NZQ5_GOSAR|nr:hypothetical protein PVK06_027027 [Gossypium arboreum]
MRSCSWAKSFHPGKTVLVTSSLCAHVVAVCTHSSINAEQNIDELYTLQRTLRVWKIEFPILHDLSTWEVPPSTFELVPDKGLRRKANGHPQVTKVYNEMDMKEKTDGKHCGVCKVAGHKRSKCPHLPYHIGQLS